jgi:hypothetical protein
MLEHMTDPRPFVFGESTNESAGLPERTTVLAQARECVEQRLDERVSEPCRRPFFEFVDIHTQPDDRKARV